MRVAVITHGCRLNQADSDAMGRALVRRGHALSHADDAQVVVLNTCTITHRADADARREARRWARAGRRVVLAGCFVDADPEAARGVEGVAALVGNAAKPGIASVVGGLASPEVDVPADALTRRANEPTWAPANGGGALATPWGRARALLKVQDGCDYRCAFCIVPSVRGASRSRTVDDIVDELRRRVDEGIPEVVLTGVHLGTYGRDLRPRGRLVALVEALLPHLGGARLRLSSVDPQEVDDELVALLARERERLCPHLHLPVQSGDEATLRRMRRGHTAARFADVVGQLADAVPGIAIGTDVIAGLPGEDADAFERTHARLAALPLSYLHVFPYSVRRGTAAATMGGQVEAGEIKRRAAKLRTLSATLASRFRCAHIGARLDVVVHRRPGPKGHEGLSAQNLRVSLDAHAAARWAGQRVHATLGPDGRTAVV